MRSIAFTAFAAGLLLAATAPAKISPGHFARTEGNTYSNSPFGSTSTPARQLQVHDDLMGGAMTIKGIAFRRDGRLTNSYAGYTVFVDVYVSTAATTAKTMNKTFDSNHGPDKKKVLSFAQISFPATVHGTMVRPFEYKLPFSTTFSYAGKASLCWDASVIIRQNTGNYYFDYAYSSSTNPAPQILNFGTGCKADKQTSPAYANGSYSMNWPGKTGSIRYTGGRLPANGLGYLMVGVETETFGGLPLPFELPGTAAGKSGKCNLYVAPILFLPTFIAANGTFNLNLGLPALSQDMNGVSFFGQVIAPSLGANALGVVTTNMVMHHLVAPYGPLPVGVVSSTSAGPSGTAYNNRGLVTMFME